MQFSPHGLSATAMQRASAEVHGGRGRLRPPPPPACADSPCLCPCTHGRYCTHAGACLVHAVRLRACAERSLAYWPDHGRSQHSFPGPCRAVHPHTITPGPRCRIRYCHMRGRRGHVPGAAQPSGLSLMTHIPGLTSHPSAHCRPLGSYARWCARRRSAACSSFRRSSCGCGAPSCSSRDPSSEHLTCRIAAAATDWFGWPHRHRVRCGDACGPTRAGGGGGWVCALPRAFGVLSIAGLGAIRGDEFQTRACMGRSCPADDALRLDLQLVSWPVGMVDGGGRCLHGGMCMWWVPCRCCSRAGRMGAHHWACLASECVCYGCSQLLLLCLTRRLLQLHVCPL